MHHLKLTDYLAALGPISIGWSLHTINHALTTLSLLLGIAYLLWRWAREARPKE